MYISKEKERFMQCINYIQHMFVAERVKLLAKITKSFGAPELYATKNTTVVNL